MSSLRRLVRQTPITADEIRFIRNTDLTCTTDKDAENARVENAGGHCINYGKPRVFQFDKMTVTLSQRSFFPCDSRCRITTVKIKHVLQFK